MSPRPHRTVSLLRVALAVPLLVIGAVALANVWIAFCVNGRSHQDARDIPLRTFAIVPGMHAAPHRPALLLRDRLEGALRLYRDGRVRSILISGIEHENDPEISAMREWLESEGVAPRDILADVGGSRTRETMTRAASLFDVRDAVVCTQSVHMPRTLFLAKEAGIDAVGLTVPTRRPSPLWWISHEALKGMLAVVEALVAQPAAPARAGAMSQL